MDTTTNQVISRSLVCVWVTGIAFPPNWTTLPHGQHMYTWSPASWKSGQPSTTRLCHTLDNHPDNHPLSGQKHIKLPALTSVGILGNDYYWIDGKGSIERHAEIDRNGCSRVHYGWGSVNCRALIQWYEISCDLISYFAITSFSQMLLQKIIDNCWKFEENPSCFCSQHCTSWWPSPNRWWTSPDAMMIKIRSVTHINRLVEERHNSSVLAMELCLSCTNPWIWDWHLF